MQLFRANIWGTKECQGMDGSKMSVLKKEDETTIFYWKLEEEKAAYESDKELQAG